jgi:hypothetical protein
MSHHTADIAAGSVAPAGCSKWNVREETRNGSKTTPLNEKTSPPSPFFMQTRYFE